MKKAALVLLATLFAFNLFAQPDVFAQEIPKIRPASCPVIYLSTSTGINNATGVVGFSFDVPVAEYVSIDAGTGLSSWGNKLYIGGRYYLKSCHRGMAISAGITRNTGVTDFQSDMETIYKPSEPVTLRLYPKTNILFAVYRYVTLGKRYNRFYFGGGWSQNISGKQFKQFSGNQLSDNSTNMINMRSPGGPMITAGFSFGYFRGDK